MDGTLPDFWSFNRGKDGPSIETIDLIWQGPFSWYGYGNRNNLQEVPDIAGVYLFTFAYEDGYILRLVGVTNSMRRRFSQHTSNFLSGKYSVLDVPSAQKGIRKEKWHGWSLARENRDLFSANKELIRGFVDEELNAYRLFVAEETDKNLRERIEAAIVINAYSSKEPWADLIDGGMATKRRSTRYMPINMNNLCSARILGLPDTMEI